MNADECDDSTTAVEWMPAPPLSDGRCDSPNVETKADSEFQAGVFVMRRAFLTKICEGGGVAASTRHNVHTGSLRGQLLLSCAASSLALTIGLQTTRGTTLPTKTELTNLHPPLQTFETKSFRDLYHARISQHTIIWHPSPDSSRHHSCVLFCRKPVHNCFWLEEEFFPR